MAWPDVKAAFDFEGECSADAISILRILAYKMWKTGFAYCGSEYLAKAIRRRTRNTVHTAINELIDRGYIYRFSGRYGGVRNVYFINIPGALAVNNSVYNKAVQQIKETGVCKLQPFGGDDPYTIVCKPDTRRCVKGAREEVNKKTNKGSESLKSCECVDYTPPPRTAPIDSPEFKEQVRQFCKEAGASDFEAARFYEHNQAEKWEVLVRMPLKTAAEDWVAHWKERDHRGWLHEQLEQIKARYGHLGNANTPTKGTEQ